MTVAFAAGALILTVATAIGHSLLGERRVLRPLFAAPREGVLRARGTRAILRAVFHLPSLTWVALGTAVLLARLQGGDRLLSAVAVIVFAAAGFANLLALRRPHPGGLMMVAAAASTAVDAVALV